MTIDLSSRVKDGECAKCGFQFPRDPIIYDCYHVSFATSTDEGWEQDEIELCQKCWYGVMMFAVPEKVRVSRRKKK